jgi:hypothetical protein
MSVCHTFLLSYTANIPTDSSVNPVAAALSRRRRRISWHIGEPPGRDIVFHLTQNIVELPIRDTALHLFVPLIIFPVVESSRQLGSLFKRELFHCRLDLLDAHRNQY